MPELEDQLRSYGSVLDRADPKTADLVDTSPRRVRRSYVVALAAVVVAVLAASAVIVNATRSDDGRPPRVVTPSPTTRTTLAAPRSSSLEVVDVFAKSETVWKPLAVAGGDVWVASEASTASSALVHLEGRDPTTGKVVSTIDVPQEAAFGIAGDGDTIWVAGGGDGGVPETTVSRVDVRTGRVVFTTTLTGTPCSCPIFAGPAGVWLTGNSRDFALHISETDGHVIANVALPRRVPSSAATEARGRLLVALEAGTVAVVDPATNRVERYVDVRGLASGESLVSMSPASMPATGSEPAIDGVMASSLGYVYALSADTWQANQFLQVDADPRALAAARNWVVAGGGDWLRIRTADASIAEFAYDARVRSFRRVGEGPASAQAGFRDAVAVGDMLWVVYDPGTPTPRTIVVVRIPATMR